MSTKMKYFSNDTEDMFDDLLPLEDSVIQELDNALHAITPNEPYQTVKDSKINATSFVQQCVKSLYRFIKQFKWMIDESGKVVVEDSSDTFILTPINKQETKYEFEGNEFSYNKIVEFIFLDIRKLYKSFNSNDLAISIKNVIVW